MHIRFRLDGRPIPYTRPMFRSKKNPKGAGSAGATKQLKDLVMLVKKAIKEQAPDWDPARPVMLSTRFGFSPSKEDGGRGKLYGYVDVIVEQIEDGHWWTKVPDVDNLSKLVMESLQHGGAVENDSQVVMLAARKELDPR